MVIVHRHAHLLIAALVAGCASTKPADYTEEIPGPVKGQTVRFEMVGIPGGDAVKPFWLGKTEVTWDEYLCFASPEFGGNDAPSWTGEAWVRVQDEEARWRQDDPDAISLPSRPYEPLDSMNGSGRTWGLSRRPAMKMTHRSARDYSRWLSRVTVKNYRLPTEREWEHACRAGGSPTGDPGEIAWFKSNSGGTTQPVGGKKPNAWGLHDMFGNVMEYVSETTPPPTHGPWFSDDRPRGVLKGGCWDDPAEALRPDGRQLERFAWNEREPSRPRSFSWHRDGVTAGLRVARSVE